MFTLENGMLKVEIPEGEETPRDYQLSEGELTIDAGFTGAVTAEYEFTTNPTREIDFKYDHNGLRTQKKVVENGITTIYDYTLHGKLITHLTKRTVDENGDETTQELHFFYDAQSKPAFVEFEGEKYRYIYNLQGDVVGIVDATGNAVVEYKYNAWGETDDVVDSSGNGLGLINPIRYRGYFFDLEVGMYYLFNRYYNPETARVCNADSTVIDAILGKNAFCYCYNSPINAIDVFGTEPSLLSFFADCHAAVQIDIVRTHQNIVMERPVTNMPSVIWRKSSNGSIDLYDTVTHEVWEVKKSTVPYRLAKRQLERYLKGQVAGCPSGSLKKGHLINGITQCGDYTVSYYPVAPGLIVDDIYDASTIMYPALSAIGMKIWQKYQEMAKGYRAASKRGTVTAIVSAVSTAAKIAAAALAVVGTIYATGSITAGLEAGKRLVYA